MASLFGEVAKEVGGAVKYNAANKREDRLTNEEEARRMQLEKMRMQNQSTLLDKRISADDKRAQRTIEANRVLQEQQQAFQTEYRDEDRMQDTYEADLKAQTDILTTAMRTYASMSSTGIVRGKDWSTKIEQQFDPTTGAMQDVIYATDSNGRTYVQQGDLMLDAGDPNPTPAQFNSIDQRRAAEARLHNGDVTAEQFKDVFGYVPSAYVFGQVSKGSDFGSFMRRNNIRLPAFGIGGKPSGDRRDGDRTESDVIRERMEKGPGAAGPQGGEMQPSIEELSDGPARDAHIEARGGTNEEIAQEMRQREGGLLSQGQAAENVPLEQGGQLDPNAPRPVTPEQARQATHGNVELDDAGAAEVGSSVGAAFSKIGGGIKDLLTTEIPYGQ